MKRVVFITEFLNPPFDEGIKKTAFHILLLSCMDRFIKKDTR